jgi:2-C-methyl-D-erythritol 2,4-cyclodiphosphate synthase
LTTAVRIGLGHDTHRVGAGGNMLLGGVKIECGHHLIGHSDADVLLHAITDAILGASALGDIGQLFPDTDSENKDRCSQGMLRIAYKQIQAAGWKINNLDCVILATIPKISPHREAIINNIAQLLEINSTQVFVKGKTGEQVGPVGRGEAVVAQCVVLLQQQQQQ